MADLVGVDVIQVIRIEHGTYPLGESAEAVWFGLCGFTIVYDDELLENWQLETSRQHQD